jgi:hypothetical protein
VKPGGQVGVHDKAGRAVSFSLLGQPARSRILTIPQVAEAKTPQPPDVGGDEFIYDGFIDI